jgi:peptide chain release factor 2
LERRLAELDELTGQEEVWTDRERLTVLSREKREIQDRLAGIATVETRLADGEALLEMIEEDPDGGASLGPELVAHVKDLVAMATDLEISLILSAPEDRAGAIVALNSGAGGTESQDWVDMLARMYQHWGERQGYKLELIDSQPGEEAGLKSISFLVKGEFVFGRLKGETGIHRLVRISPFDSQARRHTTFASVFVYPDIEDTIQIEIDDKDLRVDTFRAGGAGGQHINKTDSAVRLTHLPTGIVVQCQNERSQYKNKAFAMKVLRARLFDYEQKKRDLAKDELEKAKKEIAWGHQIRSYVLQPYRMVKDLRTDHETSNTDAVLDGDLNPFIKAYLYKNLVKPTGGEGSG